MTHVTLRLTLVTLALLALATVAITRLQTALREDIALGGGAELYLNAQFSPDGTLLAYYYQNGEDLHVWDIERRVERFAARAYTAIIRVAFSPDSAALATLEPTGLLNLWDVASGEQRLHLGERAETPGALIKAMAFSPDSRVLATANRSGVSLWNVADGTQVGVLANDPVDVTDLKFRSDGALVATADGVNMYLWDSAASERHGSTVAPARNNFRGRNVWRVVLFSPDNRYMLTLGASGALSLWDTPDGSIVGKVGYPLVFNSAVNAGDTVLVAGSAGRGNQMHVIDMRTGKSRYAVGASRAVFSPDGRWLATASGRDAVWHWTGSVFNLPNEIWLWDVEARTRYVVYRGESEIRGLWFSPDGRRLAFADASNTLRVLEIG